MAELTIRQATAADAAQVHRFVCLLEDMQFDGQLFEQYYLQNIVHPGYYYLLAVDDEKPVGYLSCHGQLLLHHLNYVYEIQELYVDAAYRGKGIGKALIEHLRALLKDKDYDMLEVACGFKRPESHIFYEQAGFGKTHFKFTMRK
ncbi:MAG TPA: GNAT family N-acetyltransferase [Flavipsychrobacter sp.]